MRSEEWKRMTTFIYKVADGEEGREKVRAKALKEFPTATHIRFWEEGITGRCDAADGIISIPKNTQKCWIEEVSNGR